MNSDRSQGNANKGAEALFTRRDFLKIGAAMPLALHSLSLQAAEGRKAPPKRVMFICNSLGFHEPYFFPKSRGDLATSAYLQDLKVKNKATVFQNLYHPGMETSNHDSEKSFLTGAARPESPVFVNSISLDQILAQKIGGETRFPFLALSIYDRGWGCSWNSRGIAIPPMHDETRIFNMLFGKEDLEAKKKQITNDMSVIACLYRDLEVLKARKTNLAQLDSFRNVIRELEAKIKHEEFWLNANKPAVPNTLSDDTTVVIGSNFGDASNHTCNNLPTIVAGGGYRHQNQTVLEKPTPLCNLYLELLHKFNIDAGQFGNGKQDLELLKG